MQARGWDQAMLTRRSGLPKQTVNVIVNGKARLPTGQQIVALSHAFGVDPNETLGAIGLWHKLSTRSPVPSELTAVYRDLGFPERRALLRIGHTLRELQSEYHAMQTEDGGPPTVEDEEPPPPDISPEEERLGLKPAAVDRDIQPPPDVEPA